MARTFDEALVRLRAGGPPAHCGDMPCCTLARVSTPLARAPLRCAAPHPMLPWLQGGEVPALHVIGNHCLSVPRATLLQRLRVPDTCYYSRRWQRAVCVCGGKPAACKLLRACSTPKGCLNAPPTTARATRPPPPALQPGARLAAGCAGHHRDVGSQRLPARLGAVPGGAGGWRWRPAAAQLLLALIVLGPWGCPCWPEQHGQHWQRLLGHMPLSAACLGRVSCARLCAPQFQPVRRLCWVPAGVHGSAPHV